LNDSARIPTKDKENYVFKISLNQYSFLVMGNNMLKVEPTPSSDST